MAHVDYLAIARCTEYLPAHVATTVGRYRLHAALKIIDILKDGPCSAEEMAYVLRLGGSIAENQDTEDCGTLSVEIMSELNHVFWEQVIRHLETYPINIQAKLVDCVSVLTKLMLDPRTLPVEHDCAERTSSGADRKAFEAQCASLDQFRREVEGWWPIRSQPAGAVGPALQPRAVDSEDARRESTGSFHTAAGGGGGAARGSIASSSFQTAGSSPSSKSPEQEPHASSLLGAPGSSSLLHHNDLHGGTTSGSPHGDDAKFTAELDRRFAEVQQRNGLSLLTAEGLRQDQRVRVALRDKLTAMMLAHWRHPVELLLRQLETHPRKDDGAGSGEHSNFAGALGHLIGVLALATKHCTDKALAEEIVSALSRDIDPMQKISVFRCRMLMLLLPNCLLEDVILDGRLFTWWGALEEGKLAKYDLMWFKPLARYAKNNWRGRADARRAHDVRVCLEQKSAWLFNKVLRCLSLPLFSPVASTLDAATGQARLDTKFGERYKLPGDVDSLMGSVSTWKFVTKFLVYSLESDPFDVGKNGSQADLVYWRTVELLLRRVQPYIQGDGGEWSWHVTTFIYLLVNAYTLRAGRERVTPSPWSRSSGSDRLTKNADTYFCYLLFPLLRKTFDQRNPYSQHASLDSLARLARLNNDDTLKISQLSAEMEMSYEGTNVEDLFAKYESGFPLFKTWDLENSLHSFFHSGLEVLNDPNQSTRIASTFRLYARLMPSMLRYFPSFVPQILDTILLGIDPTDSAKTLAVAALIVNLFSCIPCLDIGDLPTKPSSSEIKKPTKEAARSEGFPGEILMSRGKSFPGNENLDANFLETWTSERRSATLMASSAMPGFALDLFEKSLQYILDTSLDGGKKGRALNTGQALDKVNGNLLFICNFLVLSQTSQTIQQQVLARMNEFVSSQMHKDKVKTVKGLLHAVARSLPVDALKTLLPTLVKRILAERSGHVELFYCVSLLQGLVRAVGGDKLLPYKRELEAVLLRGLNYSVSAESKDNRLVHKATAKLLRRLLASLCSSYVVNDFRVVSGADWDRLTQEDVHNFWSQVPWWRSFPVRRPEWYVPGDAELTWAVQLGCAVTSNIYDLVCAAYSSTSGSAGSSFPTAGGGGGDQSSSSTSAGGSAPTSGASTAGGASAPATGGAGGVTSASFAGGTASTAISAASSTARWMTEMLESADTPSAPSVRSKDGDWVIASENDDASSCISFESHAETKNEFRRAFKQLHKMADLVYTAPSSGSGDHASVAGAAAADTATIHLVGSRDDHTVLLSLHAAANGGSSAKDVAEETGRVKLLRTLLQQPFLLADRVLTLMKALIRGGHSLWGDELTDSKIHTAPKSFPHFFEPLAIAMRLILEMSVISSNSAETWAGSDELDKQDGAVVPSSGSAATASTNKSSQVGVNSGILLTPQVTKKYLRCIGELWVNQVPCNSGSLFRTKRPAGGRSDPILTWYMSLFGESVISQMSHVHHLAKHRDVPRLWWAQRLCLSVDSLHADRHQAGYGYAGQRRQLTELLLEISFGNPDSTIREKAQGLLARASRKHVGAKGALVQNYAIKIQALKYQMQHLLRQIDFTEEQKKAFANQVNGLSFGIGGSMRGVFHVMWRGRGRIAAAFAYRLLDLLYSLSTSHQSSKEVVKTSVLDRVFLCLDIWIENRDRPCLTRRSKASVLENLSPEDDPMADASVESRWEEPETMRDSALVKTRRANVLLAESAPWKVSDFLEIFRRPDCHWRVKTIAMAICEVLCHHAGDPYHLWELYLRHAIPMLQPGSQQGLINASVRALVFGLRAHPSLVKLIPEHCAGHSWDAFFANCSEVLPRLARSVEGQGKDRTRQSFDVMRSMRVVWPTTWIRGSAQTYSIENSLFWQTVLAAMLKKGDDGGMVRAGKEQGAAGAGGAGAVDLSAIAFKGVQFVAEFCAEKPIQEEHFHTAVIELSAGAMRAARKEDAHIAGMWQALHATMKSEILTASKESQTDWQDAFRFIVTGASKRVGTSLAEGRMVDATPMAIEAAGGAAAPEAVFLFPKHAIPLLNFAMRLESGSLPDFVDLHPIAKADIECSTEELEENQESSFLQVKKMRLRLAILIEVLTLPGELPDAWTTTAISIFQHARARIPHPLKNLREEAARVVAGFLRMALSSRLGDPAVWEKAPAVTTAIRDNAKETFGRLADLLRLDIAEQQGDFSPTKRPVATGEEVPASGESSPTKSHMASLQRKPHVNESLGMLHVIIHTVSASKGFFLEGTGYLYFVVLCSTHHDRDLRALGWVVLAQVASDHTPNRLLHSTLLNPSNKHARFLYQETRVNAIVQEIMVDRWDTWGSKEREKVLLFASLLCLGNATAELYESRRVCILVAEKALLDAKPDVKFAAKRLLTALYLAEDQKTLLPRYRVTGGASTDLSSALSPLQTAQCLVILLYVSMDLGSPKKFTGAVIEALAPYGNGKKYQRTILTEVQNAFQAFLKNQQRSEVTWKECRKKLSAKQLDLIDAYKGKLSYFS